MEYYIHGSKCPFAAEKFFDSLDGNRDDRVGWNHRKLNLDKYRREV